MVIGGSRYSEVVVSSGLTVQAAFAIRGFSIYGIDYSRTAKNEGKLLFKVSLSMF